MLRYKIRFSFWIIKIIQKENLKNECLMSVFIFDKDMAELLLTQFSRLKQTKISRLGSAWIDLELSFWSRLKKLAAMFYQV